METKSVFETVISSRNAVKNLDTKTKQDLRSVIMNDPKSYAKLQKGIPRKNKASLYDILFRFTANPHDYRTTLKGLFFDKEQNRTVQSNGYILAVLDVCYPVEHSQIQDRKGNLIQGLFPTYQNIIPKNYTHKHRIDVKQTLQEILPIYYVSLSLFPDLPWVNVNVFGVPMSVDVLHKILQSMYDAGDTEIEIQVNDTTNPVKFSGTSGITLYQMGVLTNIDNCVKTL